MIAYCGKNQIEAAIVWKFDRFARNSSDHAIFETILARAGTSLFSATEKVDNSPQGRLTRTILSGIAQFDNEVRAERCRLGMERMSKSGGWTHEAPIGYRNVKINNIPALSEDPVSGSVIRQCFEQVANGFLKVKDAPQWLSSQLGRKVYLQNVHRILRNPVYIGVIQNRLTNHIAVKAVFDGLVSDAVWSKVQLVLQSGKHSCGEVLTDAFPMRGSLMCACGKRLTASNSRNKVGKIYAYYHCKCGVRIQEHVIMASFEKYLVSMSEASQPVLSLFRKIVADVWSQEADIAVFDRKRAEKRLQYLKGQQKRLLDFYLAGEITPEAYREKSADLNVQTGVAQSQISDADIDQKEAEATIGIAEAILRDLHTVFVRTPKEDRPRLIKGVFGGSLTVARDGTMSNTHKNGLINYLDKISHHNKRVVVHTGEDKNTILEVFQVIRDISDLVKYCPAA